MHVGVLTGGGDVPGLNALLYALTMGLLAQGHRLTGIKRGWHGLLAVSPGEPASEQAHLCVLDQEAVRGISQRGGTMLHSSRTNPARATSPGALQATDRSPEVLQNLASLGIDALLVIGGDDTLGYGEHLSRLGVAVIGLPKTMDNDVGGTELCIGFATCVARTVAYLHQLRTPTASHERLLVVEVMGRNSGASCLWPALLADADRALIAEVPFDLDCLGQLLLADRAKNPEGYAMVVVSEGASVRGGQVLAAGPADAYGHQKLGGIGRAVADGLEQRTGCKVMEQRLGYLVRAGPPEPMDVLLAHGFASVALELLAKRQFGRLVGIQRGRYGHEPLALVRTPTKVDVPRLYDAAQLRPRLQGALGCGLWPV